MIGTQQALIEGLIDIENETGNQKFQWLVDNNYYPCIASVSKFERELETGGFATENMLTMTVRQYDCEENPVFENGIPSPQQKVIYNGVTYRIQAVINDTIGTGGRLRIIGVSSTRGI